VPTPNLEGLIERLDAEFAERANRLLNSRKQSDAGITRALANFEAGKTKRDVICTAIRENGAIKYVEYLQGVNTVRGSSPTVDNGPSFDSPSPEKLAEYKATEERSNRIHAEVLESLKPLALQKLMNAEASAATEQAQQDAAQARLKAQIEAAVLTIGGVFAERYAAGYSSAQEVIEKIGELERKARQVTHTGDYAADWSRSECEDFEARLSDEQFASLKEFKAKLPDNTDVGIYELFDHACVDEVDDKNSRIRRLLVADAMWRVGEVLVSADCQIGTLANISCYASQPRWPTTL